MLWKKKEKIRFTPKNESELHIEEFEQFLSDNLGWNNKTKTEEKAKETKEKTEDKKSQTEDL